MRQEKSMTDTDHGRFPRTPIKGGIPCRRGVTEGRAWRIPEIQKIDVHQNVYFTN